ncbi:microcin C transport system permease protein [Haloferula luteola]|uniref:Microcin C transport system permease protein n=1 Tax=Haloferula luteola TaxID=595692 RepID=A0A840UVH5_9BACT|nr:ABC transporter permease subunit [Haloferula luteola]MBB5350197.1 microcin C transport system permease protein [Haloferula luteola]
MKAYFLRRLLLIPVTLIGITLLVFAIVRLTPGGPVEQALSRLMGDGAKRSRAEAGFSLTAAQVLEIEEEFDRDKGILRAYLEWLGALPKDTDKLGKEFPEGKSEVKIALPGTIDEVTIVRSGETAAIRAPEGVSTEGWEARVVSPDEQLQRWQRWVDGSMPLTKMPEYRAVLFRPKYAGLLQGSLGFSRKYQDPVWTMILERMPVSLTFGGISLVLIYAICLPLGVVKAIKHRSWLDSLSSLVVFGGYAIPGYALGALLVVYLAAKWRWFALGGFIGDDFATLSLAGKLKDLAYHMTLPMLCYVVSSFAMMTMLMKNNLMDNLAADYVRTAIAKGTGFRTAVFRHAFRNSIIPIATTFGANLSIFVAGSVLIEKVFDINGFGLLSFSSILEFDEPVIMGVLFVSALLMLVGNVISDLCVALVDPRVSYK